MADNDKIKLSICCGTYNRIQFLKLTLNRILKEFDGFPYEIVIADGGSTDGTLEFLNSLDAVRVVQAKLEGATQAYKTCFLAARGDYILPIHDHMMVFGEPIRQACQILDKNQQLGLTCQKTYHSHRADPFKTHGCLLPFISVAHVSIFRCSLVEYVDENFRDHYWDQSLVLHVLMNGGIVAFYNQISAVDIRFKYPDKIHDSRNRQTSQVDDDWFYKKWEKLITCLRDSLSPIDKFRMRIFNFLLIWYLRTLRNPFSTKFFSMMAKMGGGSNLTPHIPDPPAEAMLPELLPKLDRRHPLPILEKILEWIYSGCFPFTIEPRDVDSKLIFVQKFPENLVRQLQQPSTHKPGE